MGVGFFEERGLIIQLPGHRPGVAVPGTLTGSGLVVDVEVDTLASGADLQTRILVRTRSDFSFSVSRDTGALLVTMEGRILGNHIDGRREILCNPDLGCLGKVNGSFLTQFQASAGFVVKF